MDAHHIDRVLVPGCLQVDGRTAGQDSQRIVHQRKLEGPAQVDAFQVGRRDAAQVFRRQLLVTNRLDPFDREWHVRRVPRHERIRQQRQVLSR